MTEAQADTRAHVGRPAQARAQRAAAVALEGADDAAGVADLALEGEPVGQAVLHEQGQVVVGHVRRR